MSTIHREFFLTTDDTDFTDQIHPCYPCNPWLKFFCFGWDYAALGNPW